MENINIDEVLEVLKLLELDNDMTMEIFDNETDCLTVRIYDEDGDITDKEIYFNKHTGKILKNYEEIATTKRQIQRLKTRLERLEKEREEEE